MESPNVTYEQVIAYAAGQLAEQDVAAVEAHLRANPQSAQTVARFQLARQRMVEDTGTDPSPEAVARAIELFARHRTVPQRTSWLQALDRIVASLIFDSRVQPASVRYAVGAGDDRINLSFHSEMADVDLQAQRLASDSRGQANRWRLMGQVSALDPQQHGDMRVAILRPGGSVPQAETATDESGMFTFDVEPGEYDILIEMGESLVALEKVVMSS